MTVLVMDMFILIICALRKIRIQSECSLGRLAISLESKVIVLLASPYCSVYVHIIYFFSSVTQYFFFSFVKLLFLQKSWLELPV